MKKLIQYIFILLLFLAGISQKTSAQRIKATASLDSTNILIGDQVTMFLKIDKPVNVDVNFPQVKDTISEKIEVMAGSVIDTILSDNETLETLVQAYTITCFDSGSYYIPNFWFTHEIDGLLDSTPTNSLRLNVYSMAIDTTMGPTDIKMPYDAPVTLKEVMPYVLGVILIGAILFFILYSIKRKQQNKPIFSIPQKPKLPAHIIALRELDRIKAEKIWQKDKIKQFYSEVTGAIRVYIEDRFEIPAMEQTSDETITAFRYRRDLLSDKHFENLKQMLTLADMVKFAKFKPLPDEHNKALFDAYFFVNDTKKEAEKTTDKTDKPDEDGDVKEVVLN
ncbi:MAG: hypothetical protein HQ541_20975 [Mariniphaga sp.]|nr:hypothetical protein [Mariniphaga sp.]